VSLALALGLASITARRLRIESLFIDEGFGSLDQETLRTVTDTLMQLESLGRKVGVITHVTEMAEAIPTKIRLVKSRTSSRIEV
jgi:exonuclease SbcC